MENEQGSAFTVNDMVWFWVVNGKGIRQIVFGGPFVGWMSSMNKKCDASDYEKGTEFQVEQVFSAESRVVVSQTSKIAQ